MVSYTLHATFPKNRVIPKITKVNNLLTICKRYSTAAISKNPRKQGKKEIIKAQNYHKFVN